MSAQEEISPGDLRVRRGIGKGQVEQVHDNVGGWLAAQPAKVERRRDGAAAHDAHTHYCP